MNPAQTPPQRLELPADTAQLAPIGLFVKTTCSRLTRPGLPEVAVTELATNAIRHGGAQHMTIQIADQDNGYLVTFEDDGAPFDPTLPPLLPTGELREGGYGLVIVRRSAHSVHYQRRGSWNSVDLYYLTGDSP